MPFDGKTPTEVEATLEKLEIFAALVRVNQRADQSSFNTCLWSEAKHHKRLVALGIPVSGDISCNGFPGHVTMAEFIFGNHGTGAINAAQSIFCGADKPAKEMFLIGLMDRVRERA